LEVHHHHKEDQHGGQNEAAKELTVGRLHQRGLAGNDDPVAGLLLFAQLGEDRIEPVEHGTEVGALHGKPDHLLLMHELLLAQASPRREASSHVSVQEAKCGALDLVNEQGVLVQLLEGLEHRGGGRVESGEDAAGTLLRRARRRT
jgi:hypothetical protein